MHEFILVKLLFTSLTICFTAAINLRKVGTSDIVCSPGKPEEYLPIWSHYELGEFDKKLLNDVFFEQTVKQKLKYICSKSVARTFSRVGWWGIFMLSKGVGDQIFAHFCALR